MQYADSYDQLMTLHSSIEYRYLERRDRTFVPGCLSAFRTRLAIYVRTYGVQLMQFLELYAIQYLLWHAHTLYVHTNTKTDYSHFADYVSTTHFI